MSISWRGGSTRRWRKLRAYVLDRDRWVCQLCNQPIDPKVKHPDPESAHVHHLDGKVYGDDLDRMVAVHRRCNLAAGDPTRTADPEPKRVTAW
ncbi:hypothetical protein AB0C38_31795 [Amycolatopsis sp. NPDC048633]|uniref:HNH endonuclease n=1 Tax=Amycolatopsis sp. NPDC048633 TaxID=3157095 RepID=UPI0033C364EC